MPIADNSVENHMTLGVKDSERYELEEKYVNYDELHDYESDRAE